MNHENMAMRAANCNMSSPDGTWQVITWGYWQGSRHNSREGRYLPNSTAVKAYYENKSFVSFIWEINNQRQGRNSWLSLNIYYNRIQSSAGHTAVTSCLQMPMSYPENVYGALKENVPPHPHRPIGSGSTRRHDFVGVGVVLLEEVCHCGGRLWGLLCSSYAQCGTQSPSAACRSRCRTLSSFSSTMSMHAAMLLATTTTD